MVSKLNLHKEWLDKADDDELSLIAVLKSGAPSTACFLAQQMAEKYLKALLVYHHNDFPKVHDLLDLATRLLEVTPDVRAIQKELQELNRYYIETRYPGDYPEFTHAAAEAAFVSAKAVQDFVLLRIV